MPSYLKNECKPRSSGNCTSSCWQLGEKLERFLNIFDFFVEFCSLHNIRVSKFGRPRCSMNLSYTIIFDILLWISYTPFKSFWVSPKWIILNQNFDIWVNIINNILNTYCLHHKLCYRTEICYTTAPPRFVALSRSARHAIPTPTSSTWNGWFVNRAQISRELDADRSTPLLKGTLLTVYSHSHCTQKCTC